MKVQQWPIGKLKRYDKNPRKITEAAIDKVAASLKEFGFRQPIVVDDKGVIIVGHTRLESAKKMGLEIVPVHVATDLPPQKIKAYRLADNRTGQEVTWDNDLLSLEMTDLYEEDYDLKITGFDPGEIANLFGIELDEGTPEEPAVDATDRYLLLLEFKGEEEQQAMFAELQERGVECKIMN